VEEKLEVEDEVLESKMDKLRVEIKNHLKTQLDQFIQSQEAALNGVIQRQEEQLLLVQETVTESKEKISKLESDMENLKKTVEVLAIT
jgi:hypothetical protein